MPLVTFIIPSIGRDTLKRALDSLIAQTDPGWVALVGLDGVAKPQDVPNDPRIRYEELPKAKGEVPVSRLRTRLMQAVETPWMGFLDDDDYIFPGYVRELRELHPQPFDLVIFRMEWEEKKGTQYHIIPRRGQDDWLQYGNVAVSFAVRTAFSSRHGLYWDEEKNHGTDFRFIQRAVRVSGARAYITEEVYYVCPKQHFAGRVTVS